MQGADAACSLVACFGASLAAAVRPQQAEREAMPQAALAPSGCAAIPRAKGKGRRAWCIISALLDGIATAVRLRDGERRR